VHAPDAFGAGDAYVRYPMNRVFNIWKLSGSVYGTIQFVAVGYIILAIVAGIEYISIPLAVYWIGNCLLWLAILVPWKFKGKITLLTAVAVISTGIMAYWVGEAGINDLKINSYLIIIGILTTVMLAACIKIWLMRKT